MREWLLRPHVREWWDDRPDEPYPETEIREFVEDILARSPTHRYLVHREGAPFAYIQSYRVDAYPDWMSALELTEPALGVDILIAGADMLGKGHGSALLRAFLLEIAFDREGCDVAIIDPALSNARAIRAYERAGFRRIRVVTTPEGTEPSVILRTTRAELEASPR